MNQENKALIRVCGLRKHFPIQRGLFIQRQVGAVRAVDGITFDIYRNEVLGLVGESGCGKSTTGRCILQLQRPTSGEVFLGEKNLVKVRGAALQKERRRVQMIFQDPYASLNPRMTVASIVEEPMDNFKLYSSRTEVHSRVRELLKMVGLRADFANRYPHEFSGGQRQRIGIARALASDPEFIVCDEPISALDVSIQAQVVNLLQDLQQELGLTYLFISHDLSMVRYISDRLAVMYLGKIVELAECELLFEKTLHPYSKALLSSVPIPDPLIERKREQVVLEGDVPSPANPPSGCRFHTRCPETMDICKKIEPELSDIGGRHLCACHLHS